jgi:ArsR family transcriptional regulator
VQLAVARALGREPPQPGSPLDDGADVVFAARLLHHAPQPQRTMRALSDLARPPQVDAWGSGSPDGALRPKPRGGAVCVLDYEAHDDQALREQQADVWLGFDPSELRRLAEDAGLVELELRRLPAAWQGEGPDRHLAWQLLVGFRGGAATSNSERTP